MARVISDTGIPDKSVGDRADRGHAIRFARGKFTVSAPAKVPVERRFFPLPPCKPTCHNCVAPIDATGRNRYRFRGRDGRTARIINGIGSNRFRYTITVTVTVMEKEGAITTAEIATALFLPSSRRNIGLIFCAT